jgi:glycosyltransferase involved in cell wall biosynthesis
MKRIAIIIPAYNEEKRIGSTLTTYYDYFQKYTDALRVEFIIVLNGCVDDTERVVRSIAVGKPHMHMVVLQESGKGLAIMHGFKAALSLANPVDTIGFVDADMATQPQYFHDLIHNQNHYDGIIASRYMPGASVYPQRPWIKRMGSRLVYDSLVTALFGMRYHDVQCGAKIFKREVVAALVPYLHIRQWSFDVELLYLCKRLGFTVKEHPTVWHDQTGSKLSIIRDGLRMPWSLVKIRIHYLRVPVKKSSSLSKRQR